MSSNSNDQPNGETAMTNGVHTEPEAAQQVNGNHSPLILTPASTPPTQPAEPREARNALPLAKMVYNFEGTNERELSAAAGETVEVIQRGDTGWLLARYKGRVGWIPITYVRMLDDEGESNSAGSGDDASAAEASNTQSGQVA
ncbi:SH3-domain-containing protein [Thozetella sp. PMI_491]|nr:SH3-domain-containing protein [Thozetella sp. PMI_491]